MHRLDTQHNMLLVDIDEHHVSFIDIKFDFDYIDLQPPSAYPQTGETGSKQERQRVENLQPESPEPSDLPTHRLKVEPAWIDTNNHMNAAYYTVAVKDAALYAHDAWDYGDDFRIRTGESNFVIDTQVIYLRELLLGARLLVRTRILSVEEKRMSLLFEIFNDDLDYLAALVRYRVIHVRLGPPPRAAAIPARLRRRLEMVRESHAKLPLPPGHERFRSSF